MQVKQQTNMMIDTLLKRKHTADCKRVRPTRAGKSTPVFETTFNGVTQYVGIRIGSNGYIVSANPVSKWKPLK
jgi:hypothetical protein